MKKLCAAFTAATLFSVGALAMTDEEMMHSKEMMKAMDRNGDSMISKDEYMGYHQKNWDRMKKDSKGMVDMKSMSMMHDKMKSDSSMPKSQ